MTQTLAMLVAMLTVALPARAAESALDFLWARQMGGKGANEVFGLAVDKAGNLFVAGQFGLKQHQSIGTHQWSKSGGEIFLGKYAPNGNLLWLQKANGSGTDGAIAVATDEAGNAFITGYFAGTVRFGKSEFRSTSMSPDMFVAKYDPQGNLMWMQQAGGDHLDQGYGVATDADGNVYATGYFQGKCRFGEIELIGKTPASDEYGSRYGDMFLSKYSASGKLLWVRQPGDGYNLGSSVAVDSTGHAYVAGRFVGKLIHFGEIAVAATNYLCNFVVKYDPDGNVIWARPTAGQNAGQMNTIAIDREDHAFVAGTFKFTQQLPGILLKQDAGMNGEIFLLKYNSDGKLLWGRQAGGTFHYDICNGVSPNQNGSPFIIGGFDEAADFGTVHAKAGPHNPGISGGSAYVAKYTEDGEPLWVRSAGPAPTDRANGYYSPVAVVADQLGNVYIGGSFSYSVTFGGTTLREAKDFFGNTSGNAFIAKLGPTQTANQPLPK